MDTQNASFINSAVIYLIVIRERREQNFSYELYPLPPPHIRRYNVLIYTFVKH